MNEIAFKPLEQRRDPGPFLEAICDTSHQTKSVGRRSMQQLLMRTGADNSDVTEMSSCPVCGLDSIENWLKAPDRYHGRPELYQLVRCASCSFVWLENPPPPHKMHSHYTPEYHRAVQVAGETSPARWQKHTENLLRYKQGGALLDLGCSSGAFLASIKGPTWELYGVEISAPSAEKAVARTGAQVFVGDMLDAPFPAGSFDVITCFDVLEHLYRPRESMERIWEWLKPNGLFHVFLPNILSWEARIFGSYWFGLELPRHLHHFSPESLRRLTSSVGFREEFLTTPNVNYVGYSNRYICAEILSKLGISRPPLAAGGVSSLPWRAVRKATRLTALSFWGASASLAGAGPSIEAIFRKDSSIRPPKVSER
jgi:SAM-dependent methyltransferase